MLQDGSNIQIRFSATLFLFRNVTSRQQSESHHQVRSNRKGQKLQFLEWPLEADSWRESIPTDLHTKINTYFKKNNMFSSLVQKSVLAFIANLFVLFFSYVTHTYINLYVWEVWVTGRCKVLCSSRPHLHLSLTQTCLWCTCLTKLDFSSTLSSLYGQMWFQNLNLRLQNGTVIITIIFHIELSM